MPFSPFIHPKAIVELGVTIGDHPHESQTPHMPIDTSPLSVPVQVESRVQGVKLYNLPLIEDLRGLLTFGEYDTHLPFLPHRYFVIFDVPSKEIRGEHAHKQLQQLLICIKGSCSVMVDDGQNRDEFILNQPNVGLYIPPMVWGTQYRYSADAILLVLASAAYDANDYIRDYDQFIALTRSK